MAAHQWLKAFSRSLQGRRVIASSAGGDHGERPGPAADALLSCEQNESSLTHIQSNVWLMNDSALWWNDQFFLFYAIVYLGRDHIFSCSMLYVDVRRQLFYLCGEQRHFFLPSLIVCKGEGKTFFFFFFFVVAPIMTLFCGSWHCHHLRSPMQLLPIQFP